MGRAPKHIPDMSSSSWSFTKDIEQSVQAHEEVEEFEVERIVASRTRKGSMEYQVRWKGYTAADDTWEPLQNLSNATRLVYNFTHQHNNHNHDLNSPKSTKVKVPHKRKAASQGVNGVSGSTSKQRLGHGTVRGKHDHNKNRNKNKNKNKRKNTILSTSSLDNHGCIEGDQGAPSAYHEAYVVAQRLIDKHHLHHLSDLSNSESLSSSLSPSPSSSSASSPEQLQLSDPSPFSSISVSPPSSPDVLRKSESTPINHIQPISTGLAGNNLVACLASDNLNNLPSNPNNPDRLNDPDSPDESHSEKKGGRSVKEPHVLITPPRHQHHIHTHSPNDPSNPKYLNRRARNRVIHIPVSQLSAGDIVLAVDTSGNCTTLYQGYSGYYSSLSYSIHSPNGPSNY